MARKAEKKNKDIYQNQPDVKLDCEAIENSNEQQEEQEVKELDNDQFKSKCFNLDIMNKKIFDNDLYSGLMND